MAQSWRTVLPDIVPERSTCRITFTVVDETGAAIGSSNLTTLQMSICLPNGSAINSRTNVNILNDGVLGTVDGSGNGVLTLQPADTQIVSSAGSERHFIELAFTFGVGGAKAGKHQIEMTVANLAKTS